jgi:sporulation protein YlmC with PRC-barrel domain
VNNVVVDVEGSKIDGLYVAETNPVLVKGSRGVAFPYRWVQAIGDVIILKYFPKKIRFVEKGEEEEKEEEEEK